MSAVRFFQRSDHLVWGGLAVSVLIVLMVAITLSSQVTLAAPGDPACNGWTLHTRTLHTICPEVIVDHLPSVPGAVSIGGIAFDSSGALYVTRPAIGQVIQFAPHGFDFDPPQIVADHLILPGGIACAGVICDVTIDSGIIQLPGNQSIISNLPSDGLRPVLIGMDQTLYTTSGGSLIRFAADINGKISTTPDSVAGLAPAAGIAPTSAGSIWITDGQQAVHAINQPPISFAASSTPIGIAAYPDQDGLAFPQFRNSLLIVTSGSWDSLTIAGYELWDVPLDSQGKPGVPLRLIPADTELSSSDAALVALSFYPDHPVAVAIDVRGWIYIATREGRIMRLRPRV